LLLKKVYILGEIYPFYSLSDCGETKMLSPFFLHNPTFLPKDKYFLVKRKKA
jgi:hypothetical protein